MKNLLIFVTLLCFTTIILLSQDITTGLVVQFPFDSINTSKDIGVNKFVGMIHGNVTLTTNRFNQPKEAYQFGGDANGNDWIEVPHNDALNLTKNSTIALW